MLNLIQPTALPYTIHTDTPYIDLLISNVFVGFHSFQASAAGPPRRSAMRWAAEPTMWWRRRRTAGVSNDKDVAIIKNQQKFGEVGLIYVDLLHDCCILLLILHLMFC